MRLGAVIAAVIASRVLVVAQIPSVIEMEQMMDEYYALLVSGAPSDAAAYFTRDAVMSAGGRLAVGREAIAQVLSDLPSRLQLTLRRDHLQRLSSTVVLVHGSFDTGEIRGRFLRVLVHRDGQWRIAALQATTDPERRSRPQPDHDRRLRARHVR